MKNKFYIKYVIKTPLLFILFVLCGVFLFMSLTLATDMKDRVTYVAYFENGRIKIPVPLALETEIEEVFFYTDKNKDVYFAEVAKTQRDERSTVFVLSKDSLSQITLPEGVVSVSFSAGRITLFRRIVMRGGRSDS